MKKYTTFKIFVFLFIVFSFTILRNFSVVEASTITASVSGNWSDTITWGGSPVPSINDDVIINHGVVVNVDTTASCNTLSFTTVNNVSAETSVNIIGSNSLKVTGAINLAQAVTNSSVQSNNIINVGSGTLSAGSIALKGVGVAQFRLTKITASTGTINVTGNITSMGTSSRIVFTDAGVLNVGGSFMSGTAGTFTSGVSTVNFNANGNQTISPFLYSFYNVTLSGSGIKTLTNATINGILTTEGSVTTFGNYTSLSNMAITNPASKLVYTVGDILDIGGLVVTITYGDNSTHVANITSENVSGFNSSAPMVGQVLTVTIGDKTVTYTVDIVAPLSSDKAITSFKLKQVANGVIDQVGHTISVIAPYGTDIKNLDTLIEVSEGATVSPLSGVVQDFTNPVTYTVTAADLSTLDYIVTVTPITLSSISITHGANKLTYYLGESLDITGLVVQGTYSDSSTKEEVISSDNISGFNSSTVVVGQILTITVGDKTTTYNIDITERPHSSGSSGGGSYNPSNIITSNILAPVPQKINPVIQIPTSEKINNKIIFKTNKIFKIGAKNDEVKLMQDYLNKINFNCGLADGIFGNKTKQAVISFQKANGLTPDGIVGSKTKEKLIVN